MTSDNIAPTIYILTVQRFGVNRYRWEVWIGPNLFAHTLATYGDATDAERDARKALADHAEVIHK